MRKRFWYSLALMAGMSCCGAAVAQESVGDIAALKARLERLEQQNNELRQTVAQRLPPVDQNENGAPGQLTAFNSVAEMNEAQVRAIIAKYNKDQDAKKKVDDEQKKLQGYEVGSDLKMNANWKDGLEISTANKDFRIHIGGRTQFDVGFFDANPNLYNNTAPFSNPPTAGQLGSLGNTYGDGADMRRARFRIDGTFYENVEFAAEYDFVNSANIAGVTRTVTAPTDLWWTFKNVPMFQNIRIGNQKQAMGFEHMVSSRYQPFMERSYNQDTFYGGLFNGFIPGIAAMGTLDEDELGSYHYGIYKPTNSVFGYNTGNDDFWATARLTRLLMYEDHGRQLLHVGGSVQQGTAVGNNVGGGAASNLRFMQFRTRDAIRTGLSGNWPTPANITLAGDDMQTANFELVAVRGSWTFQGEYLVNGLQHARALTGGTNLATATAATLGPDRGTAIYHGGYAQVLYYLTGEHDNYEKGGERSCFGRVRPNENFFLVRDEAGCRCVGTGAWQVGARYDYLNLDSHALNGGILNNFTAGLNWFLNPNMKIQFNYMATNRIAGGTQGLNGAGNGDGWVHGLGMRFAQDF